jgi:hypothetical protein
VATGKEVGDWLRAFPRVVQALAFSPDGNFLASAGFEKQIELWDLQRRKRVPWTGGKLDGEVWNLAFAPDGNTLLSGSGDVSSIQLWELATGKERRRFQGQDPGRGFFVTLSPDGDSVVATGERWLCAWDAHTGQLIRRVSGHSGITFHAAWSADGRRLATVNTDTTGLIWDAGQFLAKPGRDAALTDARLEKLWAVLLDRDAREPGAAIEELSRSPQAVAFLKARLQPVPRVPPERLAALLADLEDRRFHVREAAAADLKRLAELAEPALRDHLVKSKSLEAQRRMQLILDAIEYPPLSPDALRVLRCLELLERRGTPDALALLRIMAAGADGARLTEAARSAVARLDKMIR